MAEACSREQRRAQSAQKSGSLMPAAKGLTVRRNPKFFAAKFLLAPDAECEWPNNNNNNNNRRLVTLCTYPYVNTLLY